MMFCHIKSNFIKYLEQGHGLWALDFHSGLVIAITNGHEILLYLKSVFRSNKYTCLRYVSRISFELLC